MNPRCPQCTLFFSKWPESGQVKTRLGRDIGPHHAARLYRFFVQNLSTQLRRMDTHAICCYEPASMRTGFRNWLGDDFDYLSQQGGNLGERMTNAFQWAFSQNFSTAIVIGTDSPDLPEDYLCQAQTALAEHDVVIGPCQDGGYYLIGFQRDRFLPEAFDGIDWSTERVFHQTQARIEENGRSLHVLPTWFDIDTRSDLVPLIRRNEGKPFAQSQSYRFICQQGWHELEEIEKYEETV